MISIAHIIDDFETVHAAVTGTDPLSICGIIRGKVTAAQVTCNHCRDRLAAIEEGSASVLDALNKASK